MPPRPEADIDQVLQAALALVAANGLKALTLRPLAEKLQTTVSVLSYRFGRKDALLAAVIEAARDEDSAFLDMWLARIQAVTLLDSDRMADLADTVLDDMARQHTTRNQFYCELLQGAAWRPEIVAPLGLWKARRLAFWRAATQGLNQPDLAEALHAYSTDEGVHGLALGDNAAYRWLRRLNLKRLCSGLSPDNGAADLELFTIFHAALGDLLGAAGDRYQASSMTEWQARVARHISGLIITEGADAVTHRAIAERADVPPSTLAYHFPRQEDLLTAGLEDVIVRVQGDVDRRSVSPPAAPPEQSGVEIARATFAIALAATRMASLRGFAADMRRRRGENYHVQLRREAGGTPRFDLLAAQAMSITGIGQVILSGGLGAGEAERGFELMGRMQSAASEER
jgi:AcrR family transcriptional regulator